MEAPEVNPKAMKRKLKRNEYTVSRSRAKRQKLESHVVCTPVTALSLVSVNMPCTT